MSQGFVFTEYPGSSVENQYSDQYRSGAGGRDLNPSDEIQQSLYHSKRKLIQVATKYCSDVCIVS